MDYRTYLKLIKENPKMKARIDPLMIPVLKDFEDIDLVVRAFNSHHNFDIVHELHNLPPRTASQYGLKFTALCLFIFDPETIKGPYFKKMKYYMRALIAAYIRTHPVQVSRYLAQARIYMRAYSRFREDIKQLISLVKLYDAERWK